MITNVAKQKKQINPFQKSICVSLCCWQQCLCWYSTQTLAKWKKQMSKWKIMEKEQRGGSSGVVLQLSSEGLKLHLMAVNTVLGIYQSKDCILQASSPWWVHARLYKLLSHFLVYKCFNEWELWFLWPLLKLLNFQESTMISSVCVPNALSDVQPNIQT